MTITEHLKPMDNPTLTMIFKLVVPVLLGALVTYAATIAAEQSEQGKQLARMQGQLAVIAQQNSDYVDRIAKLESAVDENRRAIAAINGRVLVLENGHHP